MIDYNKLIDEANIARSYAYAPYSGFTVGAALLTDDGKIYRGCNIESSVFSPSICAERTALSKAISEGEKKFKAIAIVGAMYDQDPVEECFPCGVCRQVLSEHVDINTFQIIVKGTDVRVYVLADLLPKAFVFDKG